MTARVFALPDLGEGLTDAELVRWLVARGDAVVVDQPIAEVETAKSVVEVPSPFAGIVAALHGEEGETIAVGAPLLEVEEAGAPAEQPPTSIPEAAASSGGSGQVLVGYGTTDVTGGRRARVAVATAGTRGATAATTAVASTAPTASAASVAPHIVPVVSPVIRALARSHGIDLATLRASGDGGVVTRADVEAALQFVNYR